MLLALALARLVPLVVITTYTLFIDRIFLHNKPIKTVTDKCKHRGLYCW